MNFQTLSGSVVVGHQLGRKLGFPTANINISEIGDIKQGVWLVRVEVGATMYWGVANIGFRPSVNNRTNPILEVYIFDFSDDIYGEKLNVEFIRHIRNERKFDSLELLKDAIDTDVAQAKKYKIDYEGC